MRLMLLIFALNSLNRANPGEENYLGAGIHFCAACDGPFWLLRCAGRPDHDVLSFDSSVE